MKFEDPFTHLQKQKDDIRLFSKNTIARIASYFFQGLLWVVPVVTSIWVLYLGFQYIDNLLPLKLSKGLGFVIVIAGVTILGFLGSLFITKPILHLLERIISSVPVLKFLYSTIKDFMEAFLGEKKRFTEVVIITLDKENEIERMGFVTAKDLTALGLPGKIAVYLPFSYQFAGELYLVPATSVRPANISGTEAMKFIVSGGVTDLGEWAQTQSDPKVQTHETSEK